MNKRNLFLAMGGAVVVLVGAVWLFFIRSDAPPPASLEEAVAAVSETTTTGAPAETSASTTTAPATSAPATTAAPAAEGLDGSWVVDPASSFAGYRIGEELASIGTTTAVGRTDEVEAALTFEGSSVTALEVTVDMTTLQSDRSRRDQALGSRGLETDQFPTASFVLSEPVDLGGAPVEGEAIAATAEGDLTLHGVTNSITMALEGELVAGTMVVVGSTDVVLTDYAIEAPTGFSVLSINEVGTIEVQLAFVRS